MQGIVLLLVILLLIIATYFFVSRIMMRLLGKFNFVDQTLSTTSWKNIHKGPKIALTIIFIAIIAILIYLIR